MLKDISKKQYKMPGIILEKSACFNQSNQKGSCSHRAIWAEMASGFWALAMETTFLKKAFDFVMYHFHTQLHRENIFVLS